MALGLVQQSQAQRTLVGPELTPEEVQVARSVADPAVRAAFVTRGPLYLVAVERFRDKLAEERDSLARFAVVTHYRYDGDLAIRTVVSLPRRAVVRTDTAAHAPTPLAPEELARARELALADSRVRETLGSHVNDVVVEALVVRTASPRDPLFGRRVVRLLFRVGRDYMRDPVVLVDLTAERVVVEPAVPAP